MKRGPSLYKQLCIRVMKKPKMLGTTDLEVLSEKSSKRMIVILIIHFGEIVEMTWKNWLQKNNI